MKTTTRFFIVFAIIISSISAKAQDTLYLKSGLKVASQITEITPSEVRYKKASNPDGPTYVIDAVDIHFIKYRNGTTDTINAKAPVVAITPANEQKAPVYVQAPVPAAPIDLHPPIYTAGMFYRYNNRRMKTREMQGILLSVHDPEIDLHVKKAKLDKGLEYIGFVGVPALAFGLGYTAYAFFNNDGIAYDNRAPTSYAPGVAAIALAAAALATSITVKIVGKNHNKAAIEIYNQKY
ncbi:MAG: hypothetical protein JWP12_1262 [Bacteroidetes bacterium]|nr:hypothetical protein [Bacteroidota bacterium]